MEQKYNGFIISSARTCEKNASSEMYYVLTEYLDCTEVQVAPIKTISGLSIAKFNEDPDKTLAALKELIKSDPPLLRYTLKIIPISCRVKTDLDTISEIIKKYGERISEEDKWRIAIRKRHVELSSKEIITAAANEIKSGTVDLENPDYYLIIEVIGKWTYMHITKNYELSLSDYIEEEEDDGFTF